MTSDEQKSLSADEKCAAPDWRVYLATCLAAAESLLLEAQGVIANAHGGDWTRAEASWRKAAEDFRERQRTYWADAKDAWSRLDDASRTSVADALLNPERLASHE